MPERVLIYLWCKIGSYYRKHFAIMGQKCCMAAWLCFVVNKHAAVLVCTLHTMGVPPLSNSANRAEKFLLSRLQMFAKIFLRCMLSISFSLSLSRWARGEMSCCICPPEIHSTVICFGSLYSQLQL